MANSVIGALRVMLGMDTAEFEKGATSASRSAARFEKNMMKLGGNLQKIGVGMTAALTAPLLGLAAAGTAAVNQLAASSKEMQIAAKTAGAGFEEFQRAAHAATVGAGVETEKFGDILKDTADKIGDFAATGGGEMQDFFEKIAAPQGLTVGDFLGKSSIEQLQLYVNALEKAGVSSEEMVFYLESIADEGSRLLPILTQNGAELGKLGANAAIIDPKAAAELKEYTTAQLELSTALQKLTIALVKSGLVEALADLVTSAAALAEKFSEASPTGFRFAVAAAAITAALGPLVATIGTVITIAPKVAAAFGVIRVAALALMANPVLLGFGAALTAIFVIWQNWDKIEPVLRRLYEGVERWLGKRMTQVLSAVLNPIGAVSDAFKRLYIAVVGNSYVPDMVDGIQSEFNRLQAVMVDPAQKATQSVTDAAREMASNVLTLLDRLFPEIAAARRQMEELALLDNAGLSDEARARARLRLLQEGQDKPRVSDGLINEGPLAEAEKVNKAAQAILDDMTNLGDRTEVQTVRIAETFQDMANRAVSAMRQLSEGIKSGDFFSIFEGVLSIVTTLGGAGVFGRGFQDRLRQTPGFANGGAMRLGGFGGVDRNVLSLNGSPIARVSAGETMQISPANDRSMGAIRVTVTMDGSTGALGAFVQDQAGQVIAQAAPTIARAGAGMAVEKLRQSQSRALA